MTFSDLRLAEPILRAVADEGYTAPTPIQTQAIPAVLAGSDVLGCAQTGTGKTCAFALPILDRLSGRPDAGDQTQRGRQRGRSGRSDHPRSPRALVVCPTRELASQIHDSFRAYGRYLRLRHAVIFGGVSQFHQERALRAGVDVLIATPGRLLDLLQQGCVDLRSVEIFVLDEADRMLDMGFIGDVRKIAANLPSRNQTLMFSATMPREIQRLADSLLRDPVRVQVAPTSTPADAIAQSVYHVVRANKPALLGRLLADDSIERALVFTRTKHGADKLVKVLRRTGVDANAIHGNKSQSARTRALAQFKAGRTPVLIATDIASRGIDVDEITHVINFDMPGDPETYVHRIGRTARAGSSGVAMTFCDHEELGGLRAIERVIDMKLNVEKREADLLFDAPALTPRPGRKPRQSGQSRSPRYARPQRGHKQGQRLRKRQSTMRS